MANIWNWNGFVAFSGVATLDRTIVQNSYLAGDAHVQDWVADVAKFTTFITNLRAALLSGHGGGIPPNCRAKVTDLLNYFFPLNDRPKRYRVAQPDPASPDRIADPIDNVPWGQATVAIADAPSALAYIFSVVEPTVTPPDLENYYIPLLVMLSRCICLAFCDPVQNPQVPILTCIPIMSCVMYMPAGQAGPHYVFGSTFACSEIDSNSAEHIAQRAQRRALDIYRRDTVLLDGLNFFQQNPNADLPWDPKTLVHYSMAFLRMLRGKYRFQGVNLAAIFDDPLMDQYAADAKNLWNQAGDPNGSAAKAKAWNDIERAPQIKQLIAVLLQLRTQLAYNRNGHTVRDAYKALYSFWITPVLYATDPATQTVQYPALPALISQSIQTQVNTWWNTTGQIALNYLDNFNTEVTAENLVGVWIPPTPYGRCAETYPVVGVLANYFPNNNSTLTSGVAIENTVIGKNSAVFDNSFDSAQLDSAGGQGPYRLPCINCSTLIPMYGMNVAHYNTDITTVPPQLHPAR